MIRLALAAILAALTIGGLWALANHGPDWLDAAGLGEQDVTP